MKRVLRTAMMALLVMVLFAGFMAPAAQAAQDPITVTVEADVNVKGTPNDGSYAVFELTDADGEVKTKVIDIKEGVNKVSFDLTFSKVGVYEYTFQMVGGNYYLEEYDGTVYNVKVTVYNSEDYSKFNYEVAIREEGNTAKPNAIDYELELIDIVVNKKWVDKDSTRPASVKIDLMLDGTAIDSIVLNNDNAWQGEWTGLDTRLGKYSVKENKVPSGYTATYKYADGVWTVTNTGSLLQTGQLNWPIPVLCIAGVSVLAMGLFLMFARKKENNA